MCVFCLFALPFMDVAQVFVWEVYGSALTDSAGVAG